MADQPMEIEGEIKAPEPKKILKVQYTPPVWSGKPPKGAKIEILKGGSIIGGFDFKDKPFFLLGRDKDSVDYYCEHESISRHHLMIQFKDTGEAYLYDLGSTHGTKINKRAIPGREYVKMNNSDLFKLGESTRLYIYSFEEEEPEEEITEERVTTQTESKASRKERMLKLYEENKKQKDDFQKKVTDKVGWGIGLENDDSIRDDQKKNAGLVSEEDVKKYGLEYGQQINYSALKEKKDLGEPEKALLKKSESTLKRIEKLTHELEGIQSKQAKMLDLTEGQQQRVFKIESELEELKESLETQEDNLKNMIVHGNEEDNYDEVKSHRNFFKQWENQEYEDEFYDRSKSNNFNKKKDKVKMTKADIKEGDTYESVKARLNIKMKERDALMHKLIEINYENTQKKDKEDFDELDAFMDENSKQLKSDEKEYVTRRMNEANVEIDKLNAMLTLLMPSSFATAKKVEPKKVIAEPKPIPKQAPVAAKKKESKPNGGLSSVFHKLSEMAKSKEKELKKNADEITEEEARLHIRQTPRFYESDNTEPVSMTDVEAAKYEEEKEGEEGEKPKSFFSEIIQNIKPVAEDDSIDTSKYASFVKEYNNFHQTKRGDNSEGSKRQKVGEDSETTVIKLGGNQGNN